VIDGEVGWSGGFAISDEWAGDGRHPGQVTWYAGRRHYEELLAGGVRIYEYRPTMVHAKSIAVDRAFCVVGTINFDNRSMSLNDEVALLVQAEGPAQAIHDRFLEDLELADELDLDAFRRRGAGERLIENAAVVFSRLI